VSGIPDARIMYHAGMILRDAGAVAQGGELMERALTLNPRFDLRLTEVIHAVL